MENFFYSDEFYSDLSDFLDDHEIEDAKSLDNFLMGDLFIKVYPSDLEPVVVITPECIVQELGLIGNSNMKTGMLTKKGKQYLWAEFSGKNSF